MNGGSAKARLAIAALVVAFSFLAYWINTSTNPVTGEKQRIAGITIEDEIKLGLFARDSMANQFGGMDSDPQDGALAEQVGQEVVAKTVAAKSPWRFEFHVLADPGTINAFALPGGQIFITEGLLRKLRTSGQLAGVLGHEIGHVIERHGAQQIAKQRLSQGISAAAVVASGDYRTGQMAQVVAGLIGMKYGRGAELEADRWGVNLMAGAGYDPTSMVAVMEVLKSAAGGSRAEFFSTHPNPENRIAKIRGEIARVFPQGIPSGMRK